ncbi:MAG TPA: LLM class F420-dependent oxidoreductase [Pseudonocardiaceae bacterium]|nr:LLM class F420-dependent oxidoreductase [Pseudonocardiaceae bacterium]
MAAVELGRLGVWIGLPGIPEVTDDQLKEFAGQVEQAGYGAFWVGSAKADFAPADPILAGTTRLAFATGILNTWTERPDAVVAGYRRVQADYPDRVIAGIGIGHPEREDNKQYAKPYASLVRYLDDVAEIPKEHLALAALGPKVLKLSAQRTAGAHPYFTTPEHTRQAREILGQGVLLAPEQKVVLETDAAKARDIGRRTLGFYLRLVNYRNSFLRLGFTEADFADGGSDRLVDATVAWGDAGTVAARIAQHHQAGADHVAVQVLGADNPLPIAELREVSAALA